MASIYSCLGDYRLRDIEILQGHDYIDKMMHAIPDAPVVKDRADFIVERCKGKRVLNLGCASGGLHQRIKAVAAFLIGVDRVLGTADIQVDLDFQPHMLYTDYHKDWLSPELIVAGEILEHLANPGLVLTACRRHQCPMLITVPNAFHSAGLRWMKDGYEQVNPDHVAWYSYRTMKTLVERYSFTIQEFYWYNGKPLTAEGMIFVVN